MIGAVYAFRLEVGIPPSASIYFTSGTADPVLPVESTLLLPLLFVAVAALLATAAQRMAREMAARPPLTAYTLNIAGSLTGVIAFAVISWLELPPAVWFTLPFAAAIVLLVTPEPAADYGVPAGVALPPLRRPAPRAAVLVDVALLAVSLILVHIMARGALWSPYYKITVGQNGGDTVVEVNNIFHQSMAPVAQKEYFYQWPYAVFGNTFKNVLILGAGSGTDVAAALMHGAEHVDAVDIDPVILRLGRELHPDRPFADPRVTVINDDARHFLRTTTKKYDLVVFALIDSLTMQSRFSGVRLESYMFTKESFRAVRDRLTDNGVLAVYNYFREPWLVDRLANTAAAAFGAEPQVHVHEARSFLGVMLAGPRLTTMKADPGDPGSRHGIRPVARAKSGADARARQSSSRRPTTGHFSICAIGICRGTTSAAAADPGRLCGRRPLGRCAAQGGRLVLAVLPARRRLHAAGDQVDHPVCAVVGIDVGRRVAGDRVGAGHGARWQLRSYRD